MRLSIALLFSIPILALGLSGAGDASACGGCFHEPSLQQSENTQVTGHRMILSISKTQTTLWDQVAYQGAPSSFAWVLPIKGMVDVGLSSDLLFEQLESSTNVSISSPQIACAGPPYCGGFGSTGSVGSGGFGASTTGSGGVVVTGQKVVGPYETVQLHSSDPAALSTWLAAHNYVIPDDVKPIIDGYVTEGFDFLALKLVPGMDVTAMRPVRVTSAGASPVLPLRMVAAGTGATTSVNLWVLGEGRYQASNMPNFTVSADDLTWDWDTMSSNYAVVKKAAFDASMGKAWLTEAGEPFSLYNLQSQLGYLVQNDPIGSGYADSTGAGATPTMLADLAAVFGGLNPNSVWITRLHGELSRAALAGDLTVGASPDQSQINRYLVLTKTKGTAPMCPTYPPCPDPTTSGDPNSGAVTVTVGGVGGADGSGGSGGSGGSSGGVAVGGCTMTQAGGFSSSLGFLGVLAALAFARRRQAR